MHEIPQAAAAGRQRILQRLPDLPGQPPAAHGPEPAGRRRGMDAGPKQALGSVDVADADQQVPIHDGQLDRRTPPGQQPGQPPAVERGIQRLAAEPGQQGVRLGRRRQPQNRTETPRIAQAQGVLAQHQIEMVMPLGRQVGGHHPQAARHAEMQHQRAGLAIDEDVLRPPPYAGDPASDQHAGQPLGHRIAQARLAHPHRINTRPSQPGLDAPARDLHLRQLRHDTFPSLRNRPARQYIADKIVIKHPCIGEAEPERSMHLSFRIKPSLLAFACAGLLLTGPAALAAETRPQRGSTPAKTARPPLGSAQLLAQMLLSEIALARGMLDDAAYGYGDLARQTDDPRIVRRANEIEIARIMQRVSQKPDEAEAALARVLASRPDVRGLLLQQLPAIFAQANDRAGVATIIARLTSPYPGMAEAHYATALVEREAEHRERAFAAAKKAVELRPDWQPGLLLLLETANDEAARNDAVTRLRSYTQAHPEAVEAGAVLARWEVQNGRKEAGVADAQRVLGANPENNPLRFAMVGVLIEGGDLAGAETLLERLIADEWGETDRILLVRAEVQEELGKTASALAGYDRVPPGQHFVTAQARRARLLAAGGQLDAALAGLETASARAAEFRTPLRLQQTLLLREAERRKEALTILDAVLAEEPDNVEALYDSALLAEQSGQPEQLERRLRRVLELQPDNAQALNALAYSLTERKIRLDEAADMLKRAIALAPDDPAILDSMGWLLFQQGRAAEAEDYLRRAYAAFPDPEVVGHLIEVEWALGKKAQARQRYTDAIAAAPGNPILLKLARHLGL